MFVHFGLEMCAAPQPRTLLNISTSKSALTVVCFVHFDFQMCFVPQRCALFRHRNFQKWRTLPRPRLRVGSRVQVCGMPEAVAANDRGREVGRQLRLTVEMEGEQFKRI